LTNCQKQQRAPAIFTLEFHPPMQTSKYLIKLPLLLCFLVQVCFQLWMSTTMSADALAVAAQALLARSVAAGDLRGARAVAERCIVLGMGLGAALAVGVGIFRHPIARVFTSDEVVLALIASECHPCFITQRRGS
jgi:hypothetical protein